MPHAALAPELHAYSRALTRAWAALLAALALCNLALALLASVFVIAAYPLVKRLDHPVQWFDALGLSFFAVFGAHKALAYDHNAQVAIMLGVVSAVGGGAMRDVLLNRTPLILRKEIYASAALAAAVIQVAGERLGLSTEWLPWVGIVLCFSLRYLAMRHHWNLPRFSRDE